MFPHLRIFIAVVFFCAGVSSNAQQADDLLSAGKSLFYDGKYDSALIVLQSSLELFEEQNATQKIVETKYAIGDGYMNLNNCAEAKSFITEALELAKERFDSLSAVIADGYYYLSRTQGGCARQFEMAIATLHKSSQIKQALFGSQSQEMMMDQNMLGYYYQQLGKYDSALLFLHQAYEFQMEAGISDSLEYSRTLSFLSKCYDSKEDLRRSLQLAEEAAIVREKTLIPNHPTISNSYQDIGNIYRRMGNYDKALEYYLPVLEMRIRSLGGDHPNVGASYYTIGNLYGNLFNYQKSVEYVEQGNLIWVKKYGEKNSIYLTYLAYLGRLYGKLGLNEKALEIFNETETLARKHLRPDHPYLGNIYNTIGNYYASEPKRQIDYLNKAIEIYQQAYGQGTIREAEALAIIGDANYALGDSISASENYNEALSFYDSKLGPNSHSAGKIYLRKANMLADQGLYPEGIVLYDQAIATVADSIRQRLPASIEGITHREFAFRCLFQMANRYLKMYEESKNINALEQALERYLFGIELVERISFDYEYELTSVRFEEERRQVFEHCVSVLYLLHQQKEDDHYKQLAFNIIERSKSPVLRAHVRDQQAKRFVGVPDSLLDVERSLRISINYFKSQLRKAEKQGDISRISFFKKEVFEASNEFEDFKSSLSEAYPNYYRYKYANDVMSLSEVQQALSAKRAVIEYFETDTYLYSFLISRNKTKLFRLEVDTMELIDTYYRSLTDNQLIVDQPRVADSLYVSSASKLYVLLLKPHLEVIEKDISKLVIIPDGKLSQVNFNVLLESSPATESFSYQQLSYLTNRYDLSYAYSSTLNFRDASGSDAADVFAGFAPSYPPEAYADLDSQNHPLAYQLVRDGRLPLPGAIDEVVSISDFLGGDAWINEAASESAFKKVAGDYSILHLAMHSLLDTEDPEYSELLFNMEYDSLDNGYLTINEIYNLDLRADLVVLSACSSGSGKRRAGEGPISFSRAFSYAGCPGVIMTMWKIPDGPTSEIMVSFYEFLSDGDPKDLALKKAQIRYLENQEDPLYQHPFFWASFVTMGDTAPLEQRRSNVFVIAILGLAVLLLIARVVRRKRAFV